MTQLNTGLQWPGGMPPMSGPLAPNVQGPELDLMIMLSQMQGGTPSTQPVPSQGTGVPLMAGTGGGNGLAELWRTLSPQNFSNVYRERTAGMAQQGLENRGNGLAALWRTMSPENFAAMLKFGTTGMAQQGMEGPYTGPGKNNRSSSAPRTVSRSAQPNNREAKYEDFFRRPQVPGRVPNLQPYHGRPDLIAPVPNFPSVPSFANMFLMHPQGTPPRGTGSKTPSKR